LVLPVEADFDPGEKPMDDGQASKQTSGDRFWDI